MYASQRSHSSLLLIILLLVGLTAAAQPGGHGGPGGRPPMGRPGMSPNGPRQRGPQTDDKKASQIKKKAIGSTYKVVGSLRDSASGESAPYVNVSILTRADSTFVKGASTNLDGYFEINDIEAGDYLLRVSAIGYRNLYRPFTVENNTALGTIRLQSGSTTLKEVKITAERPLYSVDGEKTIYNVSEDPSIQTGTTSDALQNAPGVEVDIEGNITLRGVSSVEIWVNDKPSKLNAENLKTYLETLPANALARIETITNPSAKYATDAEAVINIVTSAHIKSNQFVSFGINGSSAPSIRPNFSYVWAKENLSLSLYVNGRYNFNKNHSSSTAFSRRDGQTAETYDTIQYDSTENDSHNKNLGGSIFLSVDYTIDTSSNIDGYLHTNYSHPWSGSSGTRLRDETFVPDGQRYLYVDSTSNTGSNNWFGMFGVNYLKKFDNQGHNLRLWLNGNMSNNDSKEYRLRTYDQTIYNDLNYNKYYHTLGRSLDLSFGARYNRPYSADGELSFGLGYGFSNSNNIYDRIQYDSAAQAYRLADTLRSYEFWGQEHVIDASAGWTRRWGGFTLELGLGVSYTNSHFRYDNSCFPDDTTYNFVTWRPSIHLSYRTEDMHTFKLNYTLRMHNPGEYQLTHFRTYTEDSYSTGNRNLSSAFTHSAELGWTKFFDSFGYVGIDGYGSFSSNEMSSLTDITDEADPFIGRVVNYSMPYNMGSSFRVGGTAYVTYRPTGFINVRFYANLYDAGYSMYYEKQHRTVKSNMFSYSLRLNAWVKFLKDYQVYANLRYSSPTQSLFATSKARYSFDLGLRADFFKRKLSAFIHVQDLFNWGGRYGSGSENTNPYYLSNSTNKQLNSRFISAGITLRFGKMELERSEPSGGERTE